jgi:hypothetical protein
VKERLNVAVGQRVHSEKGSSGKIGLHSVYMPRFSVNEIRRDGATKIKRIALKEGSHWNNEIN